MPKKILAFLLTFFSFSGLASAQLSINLMEKKDVYLVNPGSALELDVNIRNAYRAPVTTAVYTVDGTTTKTGSFAAKQNTDEQLFFGQWAKMSEELITLEGSSSKDLKLVITVPANATPGDYSGAIIVSKVQKSDVSATSENSAGATAGLNFTTRLARPIYISVAGDKTTLAKVGDFSYEQSQGNQYKLYTDLKNEGNTTVKFVLETTIKSFQGETKTINPLEVKLFPGSTSNGEIAIGQLSSLGSYEITQNISFFEQNLLTGEEKAIGNETKTLSILIIPWLEIILILALLALIIFFFVWKKLHFNNLLKSSKKYVIKQGDSIMSVAKQNGVHWKTLVKINNLKPPYEVPTGKSILIPPKK